MSNKVKMDIDFEFNMDQLLKLLNVNESSPVAKRALKVAKGAEGKVKPKYILKEVKLGEIGNDFVEINSQKFYSKVIAKHLKKVETAFAFIATGGVEIAEYLHSVTNTLDNYILDQIAYMGFLAAIENKQNYLLNNYNIEKFTSLAPGSIPDWELKEVKKIFKLIGNDYEKIGVSVIDSGIINPIKSVSGILFNTDNPFYSCMICQMVNCPNRKAEFDKAKQIEMLEL